MAEHVDSNTHIYSAPPKGSDINLNITVSGQEAIDAAKKEIEQLGKELDTANNKANALNNVIGELRQELANVRAENEKLKKGIGLDELETELRTRREMAYRESLEFKNFLVSAKLDDTNGNYSVYFNQIAEEIRQGYRTAAEAIAKAKHEFSNVIQLNGDGSSIIDPESVRLIEEMVTKAVATMEALAAAQQRMMELQAQMQNMVDNAANGIGGAVSGGGNGTGGNAGAGFINFAEIVEQIKSAMSGVGEESKAAYNALSEIIQIAQSCADVDITKLRGVLDIFKEFSNITGGGGGSGGGGGGGGGSGPNNPPIDLLLQLIHALKEYAAIDTDRLNSVSNAFRNIADVGQGRYGTTSIDNIIRLAKELSALSASGEFGRIHFDFTGLNNLKFSGSSAKNLTNFLQQVSMTDMSKLEQLTQANFGKLSTSLQDGADNVSSENSIFNEAEDAYNRAINSEQTLVEKDRQATDELVDNMAKVSDAREANAERDINANERVIDSIEERKKAEQEELARRNAGTESNQPDVVPVVSTKKQSGKKKRSTPSTIDGQVSLFGGGFDEMIKPAEEAADRVEDSLDDVAKKSEETTEQVTMNLDQQNQAELEAAKVKEEANERAIQSEQERMAQEQLAHEQSKKLAEEKIQQAKEAETPVDISASKANEQMSLFGMDYAETTKPIEETGKRINESLDETAQKQEEVTAQVISNLEQQKEARLEEARAAEEAKARIAQTKIESAEQQTLPVDTVQDTAYEDAKRENEQLKQVMDERVQNEYDAKDKIIEAHAESAKAATDRAETEMQAAEKTKESIELRVTTETQAVETIKNAQEQIAKSVSDRTESERVAADNAIENINRVVQAETDAAKAISDIRSTEESVQPIEEKSNNAGETEQTTMFGAVDTLIKEANGPYAMRAKEAEDASARIVSAWKRATDAVDSLTTKEEEATSKIISGLSERVNAETDAANKIEEIHQRIATSAANRAASEKAAIDSTVSDINRFVKAEEDAAIAIDNIGKPKDVIANADKEAKNGQSSGQVDMFGAIDDSLRDTNDVYTRRANQQAKSAASRVAAEESAASKIISAYGRAEEAARKLDTTITSVTESVVNKASERSSAETTAATEIINANDSIVSSYERIKEAQQSTKTISDNQAPDNNAKSEEESAHAIIKINGEVSDSIKARLEKERELLTAKNKSATASDTLAKAEQSYAEKIVQANTDIVDSFKKRIDIEHSLEKSKTERAANISTGAVTNKADLNQSTSGVSAEQLEKLYEQRRTEVRDMFNARNNSVSYILKSLEAEQPYAIQTETRGQQIRKELSAYLNSIGKKALGTKATMEEINSLAKLLSDLDPQLLKILDSMQYFLMHHPVSKETYQQINTVRATITGKPVHTKSTKGKKAAEKPQQSSVPSNNVLPTTEQIASNEGLNNLTSVASEANESAARSAENRAEREEAARDRTLATINARVEAEQKAATEIENAQNKAATAAEKRASREENAASRAANRRAAQDNTMQNVPESTQSETRAESNTTEQVKTGELPQNIEKVTEGEKNLNSAIQTTTESTREQTDANKELASSLETVDNAQEKVEDSAPVNIPDDVRAFAERSDKINAEVNANRANEVLSRAQYLLKEADNNQGTVTELNATRGTIPKLVEAFSAISQYLEKCIQFINDYNSKEEHTEEETARFNETINNLDLHTLDDIGKAMYSYKKYTNKRRGKASKVSMSAKELKGLMDLRGSFNLDYFIDDKYKDLAGVESRNRVGAITQTRDELMKLDVPDEFKQELNAITTGMQNCVTEVNNLEKGFVSTPEGFRKFEESIVGLDKRFESLVGRANVLRAALFDLSDIKAIEKKDSSVNTTLTKLDNLSVSGDLADEKFAITSKLYESLNKMPNYRDFDFSKAEDLQAFVDNYDVFKKSWAESSGLAEEFLQRVTQAEEERKAAMDRANESTQKQAELDNQAADAANRLSGAQENVAESTTVKGEAGDRANETAYKTQEAEAKKLFDSLDQIEIPEGNTGIADRVGKLRQEVQGQLDELKNLIDNAAPTSEDRVKVLGKLTDIGRFFANIRDEIDRIKDEINTSNPSISGGTPSGGGSGGGGGNGGGPNKLSVSGGGPNKPPKGSNGLEVVKAVETYIEGKNGEQDKLIQEIYEKVDRSKNYREKIIKKIDYDKDGERTYNDTVIRSENQKYLTRSDKERLNTRIKKAINKTSEDIYDRIEDVLKLDIPDTEEFRRDRSGMMKELLGFNERYEQAMKDFAKTGDADVLFADLDSINGDITAFGRIYKRFASLSHEILTTSEKVENEGEDVQNKVIAASREIRTLNSNVDKTRPHVNPDVRTGESGAREFIRISNQAEKFQGRLEELQNAYNRTGNYKEFIKGLGEIRREIIETDGELVEFNKHLSGVNQPNTDQSRVDALMSIINGRIQANRTRIENTPITDTTADDIQKVTAKLNDCESKAKALKAEFDDNKYFDGFNSGAKNLLTTLRDVSTETQRMYNDNKVGRVSLTTAVQEFDKADKLLQNSQRLYGTDTYNRVKGIKDQLASLIATAENNGRQIIDIDQSQFRKMIADLSMAKAQINEMGKSGKSFFSMVDSAFKKFGGWMMVTRAVMQIGNKFREMITNVRNLDAAMTELRKVTDETETAYTKFFSESTERAKMLGATVTDTVNATADFARLGYSLGDASELAEAALVYKNVGDGISDVGTASESIISTMKAFGIEADNAMSIVDRFNSVGNNFAISSAGVGEALLNSASALAAAGNTLDETIALVTAANNVIQNPDKVGTALRTVSMYLRAAKTEAEDAGESTDGMAESVSKLRDSLLKLTGGRVDIQIDED